MLLIKDVFCVLNVYYVSVFGLFFLSICSGFLFYINVYMYNVLVYRCVVYRIFVVRGDSVLYF